MLSMAIIVAMFAINPRKHAKCYRKAYVRLDHCINLCVNKPNRRLSKALLKGERDISESFDGD